MGISYNDKSNIFHIFTETTSYQILLYKERYPLHLYWGGRLYDDTCQWQLEAAYRRQSLLLGQEPDSPMFSLEYLPFEYPSYGSSDFRPPAYQVQDEQGHRISDAIYQRHEIFMGKPSIPGLPACYCQQEQEAQTLVITLLDRQLGLELQLFYTVLEGYDVITRHVQFRNLGNQSLTLLQALSMSLDMKHCPQEMLHLCGTALRETYLERQPLGYSNVTIESTRGISSHQQNPFAALVDRKTDETTGNVFAVSLVYSGNFKIEVAGDMYGGGRLQAGINPFEFGWALAPGDSFATPEALLVYSGQGLERMSHCYHRLFRERLSRGSYRDTLRPILLNTWEAFYFDFTHQRIVELAHAAAKTGIELLVLDDGWFGHRDNSRSSLGDWQSNPRKLPQGLAGLCKDINALGLKMGLWFEPEMVSPDSDLYRSHPDWCIHVPHRKRTEWRSQLVLDLSREDVCDYVIDSLTTVLQSANIEYVKWDCNRRITEAGSALLPSHRQCELFHRYLLGLYRILEKVTARFPHVLFENCASGGSRFDPGMMHYFSQNWASDNTDAVCRLKIQHGASLLYPPLWITSHISASPNHQLLRDTPLQFREHVCQPFNLGYELDLLHLSEAELEEVSQQIVRYKKLRPLVQFGHFYRLRSPFEGEDAAWMIIAPDQSEFLVWYYKPYAQPEEANINIRLRQLCPTASYQLVDSDRSYNGSVLMQMGLTLDWRNGDHFSQCWHFTKICITNPA